MLTFGIVGTILSLYYYMWLSVPSTIMIKAGVDQQLDFNIPATGELYKEAVAVSGNVDSDVNISDSVYIDLGGRHPKCNAETGRHSNRNICTDERCACGGRGGI